MVSDYGLTTVEEMSDYPLAIAEDLTRHDGVDILVLVSSIWVHS